MRNPRSPQPPRLARAILRVLLPPALADPLEGDLEEGFQRRAAEAPARARRWYWRQVLGMPVLALRWRARRLQEVAATSRVPRVTGREWMTGTVRDLRVALRTLARRPAFAAVTVVTLALSIGPATLLFSVTEGVLLRPLPYADPGRVVNLYLLNEEWRDGDNELLRASWDRHFPGARHLEAWSEGEVHLTHLGAYAAGWRPMSVGEVEEDAMAIRVDEGIFPTLGVEPLVGRLPTPEEYRTGAPVAVLRHDLRSTAFGSGDDVLGRSFRYGDVVYTVIGVMPPGFFFPYEDSGRLWIPYPPDERTRASRSVGRLAPGASADEASRALDAVARRLGDQDPVLAGFGARAVPRLDEVVRDHRSGLLLLFGTALVVVLVACVNLANLVLARGARRRGELAVRTALGASTGSVARAVFVEVAVVSMVGGGVGILTAWLVFDPFVAALDASLGGLPRSDGIALNGAVLLFSVGTTLGTALVAG
jgi:putative ABC transport system permease protein